MKKVPIILIYSRIMIGFLILMLSLFPIKYNAAVIILLITIGLLTDIFDGIIARRLNISSSKLRRLDSIVDQVFWIFIVAAAYILYPSFFKNNLVQIIVLFAFEILTYVISLIRFGKEVATHAILSKIWTLSIFATLIQIIATGNATYLFQVCFYLGIITRLEIILILFVIKHWVNDVPTLYHAMLIRHGKNIKRSKWFNG